jgi:hypothetical protein
LSNYSEYSADNTFDNSLNQLSNLSQLNGLDQNNGSALRTFQQQMAAAASSSLASNGVTTTSSVPNYPSITNSNHSALTNSTFELFQRSFQRENMPNGLRNGNERSVG